MKQTHKRRALGDIQAVIGRTPSIAAAAAELGVNESTVRRWLAKGDVANPRRRVRRLRPGVGAARPGESPEAWGRRLRRAYEFSATELQLVGLAVRALTIANDNTAPRHHQLAAMGRYQRLVEQLDLEEPSDGEAEN